MGEKYIPKKGDHVRVVLEGEVGAGSTGRMFTLYPDNSAVQISFTPERVDGFNISVEKIEPPVEFFKPGDVVRSTGYPEHVYTLGKDGYYSHMAEKFYEPCGPFTSAEFELVYRP
jgi:hypothetical protein